MIEFTKELKGFLLLLLVGLLLSSCTVESTATVDMDGIYDMTYYYHDGRVLNILLDGDNDDNYARVENFNKVVYLHLVDERTKKVHIIRPHEIKTYKKVKVEGKVL